MKIISLSLFLLKKKKCLHLFIGSLLNIVLSRSQASPTCDLENNSPGFLWTSQVEETQSDPPSLKEITPRPQTLACMNSVSKEFKLIYLVLSGWVWWYTYILESKGNGHHLISELSLCKIESLLFIMLPFFYKEISNIWLFSFLEKPSPFSFAHHSILFTNSPWAAIQPDLLLLPKSCARLICFNISPQAHLVLYPWILHIIPTKDAFTTFEILSNIAKASKMFTSTLKSFLNISARNLYFLWMVIDLLASTLNLPFYILIFWRRFSVYLFWILK